MKTYGVKPPQLNKRPTSGRFNPVDLQGGLAAGAVTFELNTSMILLPKEPMRKRYFDPRVGIFATGYTVSDGEAQRTLDETIAVRWRLEPKSSADAARQQRGERI